MGENWHYVSCKNKVQEIRGYKNYILFKQSNEVVDLHIVDTVFTNLEVELLQPLFEEKKEFIEQVERSVERIGFKDPFVVHNIHLPIVNTKIQFKIPAKTNEDEFITIVIDNPTFTPTSLHIATILAKQGTNIVVIVTATIH